jgi:predicted transcriptional regulator of viral defense system
MDNITMENKNTSTHFSNILAYLSKHGKVCFKFNDTFKALPNLTENTVRKLLIEMIKQDHFIKLKEGVFYLVPDGKQAKKFVPNRHVIADNIVKAKEHYIGYGSALQIHNLIIKAPSTEQIVVSTQIKPGELSIKNMIFKFIYHNKKHFFGYKKIEIDSINKVYCSDLEKTIIDCLFKPDYAGGIVEISKAIYNSKNKIKFDLLLNYAKKFNSQAVIKRLGFILTVLEIETKIVEKLSLLRTPSFEILDYALPQTTNYNSEWSLQQNIETKIFKKIIRTAIKNAIVK